MPPCALKIIAPPGAGKLNVLGKRLVSELFHGTPVVLVSLDPVSDPYHRKVQELGGRRLLPSAKAAQSDEPCRFHHLSYLCWAAAGARASAEKGHAALLIQLQKMAHSLARTQSKLGVPLLLVDGCHWLSRRPVAAQSEDIRAVVLSWLAARGDVIAVGREENDLAWLDGGTHKLRLWRMHTKYSSEPPADSWMLDSDWRCFAV